MNNVLRASLVAVTLLGGACSSDPAARAPIPSPRVNSASTAARLESRWCVPVSRDEAIAQVMKLSAEVAPSDTARAKLVAWPELHRQQHDSTGPLHNSSFTDETQFWLVEVQGSVVPEFARGGRYSWGVFDVDAHTGHIPGTNAGKGSSAPYWDSLPDHSTDCKSKT